jgi:hypothetical protein
MKTAGFIFTCSYNHGLVSEFLTDLGVDVITDPYQFFNQHLRAISRAFLPRINPDLIQKLDMKLCPEGNPLLVFYSKPLKYSVYHDNYLVIAAGKNTTLPVIMEIQSNSPNYAVELKEYQ